MGMADVTYVDYETQKTVPKGFVQVSSQGIPCVSYLLIVLLDLLVV